MEIEFDKSDLKIKHSSGEYVNLPSSPEPDDVLYFLSKKRKITFTKADLLSAFGSNKAHNIDKSIETLDFHGKLIKVTEDQYQLVK